MFSPEFYEYTTQAEHRRRDDILLGEDMPTLRGFFDILVKNLYSYEELDPRIIRRCLKEIGIFINRTGKTSDLKIERKICGKGKDLDLEHSKYFDDYEEEDEIIVYEGGMNNIRHHFGVLTFILCNDVKFCQRSIHFHLDEIAYELGVDMPNGMPNIERLTQ